MCPSNGTSRSRVKPTHMILSGKSTSDLRHDAHMQTTLKAKQWLFNLWQEQNGLCPICNQLMTRKTGWQSHWIVWRSKGGSDTQGNRVLLHPRCHQQLHSQGLSVTKPRPADTTRTFERLEPDKKISHSSGSSLSNVPVVSAGRGFVTQSSLV